MPNGGSDCCARCDYNHARGELGMLHPDDADPDRAFHLRSYCVLRRVKIPNPFWTYCANFVGWLRVTGVEETVKADGPIFANGLYEGYVRIPWHGDVEPEVGVPVMCSACGRKTAEGISVSAPGIAPLGFCTNRHYVEWWKSAHDDPRVVAEGLASPDEYYKDDDSRPSG